MQLFLLLFTSAWFVCLSASTSDQSEYRLISCMGLTHRLLGEQRWGINKDTVLQRMFAAYANPDLAQSEQRMPYSDAIRVLCSLGCGNRVKQAEALFTVCDEDGGGLVTRAELLKFIAGSLPDDTVQHKTETFSKVSI